MQRPSSIVSFDRCYLAAIVVGIINTVIGWQRTQALVQVQRANEMIGGWYMPTLSIASVLVALLLWYLTAYRASVVAKWIVTVFFAIGVLLFLFALLMGTLAPGLNGVLSVVAIVLQGVAVTMLFRPDALAWFGEQPGADA